MDPYTFGVVATLNLLVLYSSFSDLGTMRAAEVQLPYLHGKGDIQKIEDIREAIFSFNLITSVTFSIVVAAWAVYVRSEINNYLFMGVLVYCVYFIINQIAAYYIILLRSTQEFVFLGKYIFVTSFLTGLGNVVAVWFFGYIGFLTVTIVVALIQVATLFSHACYRPIFNINPSVVKILLLSGLPMLVSGLSFQGLRTIDNFLVLRLLNTEQLGQYSIALMANAMIFSLTTSISTVLFPSMQEAYGMSGNNDSMRDYVTRPSIVISQLLPVMIGSMYFIIPLIVHWLIPKYESGVLSFKIIVLFTYFYAMTNMFFGFLTSMQKQKWIILINVVILILIFVLAETFTFYKWGLEGIALATGIGYFCYFIVVATYTLRHWASWSQTIAFLNDISLPFVYSAVLIYVVDHYFDLATTKDNMKYTLPFLQMSLFFALYLPCIFVYDRKSHLYSELFTRIFKRK